MALSQAPNYYLELAKALCRSAPSSLGLVRKPRAPVVIRIISESSEIVSEEVIESLDLSKIRTVVQPLSFHLKTILLFIYSDLKTVVFPWTLFGLANALSAPVFGLGMTFTFWQVLSRTPLVALWILLNLVPFTIGNQRQKAAILEDGINKPWRPLPSKRISSKGARDLMLGSYLVATLFSIYRGGVSQTIMLAILGYLYNDLGGGDKSCITRNLLNGLGFISFGSGAMEVALGRQVWYSPMLAQWLRIIVLVVFTGIHSMDMYDQAGDSSAKRRTLPLVVGDEMARWSIAFSVLAWSFACPWFWAIKPQVSVLLALGGAVVAWRTLKKKTVKEDKKTAKLWNLWLMGIYCLPLVKVAGANLSTLI